MAEMTRDEFMRSIGMTPAAAPAQTNAVPLARELSLAPLSEEALNKQTQAYEQSRIRSAPQTESDFAAKVGARPGIPMDMENGIPFMQRLRLAVQPTAEEEEKALNAAYPGGKVRRNDYGWLIVETRDENGKAKDVLVDPIGVDMGDLASLAATLPEIAGGALSALKLGSRAPGVINAFKTLVATAVGSEAGGAVKDVGARMYEGNNIDPVEIGKRRAIGAGVGMGFEAVAGGAAKAVTKGLSPFSNLGERQFNARAAQQFFKDKYGIALQLTPAEATGNTFLLKSEAQQMQKPGASLPFEKLIKEREQQISALQREAMGGDAPDEELAGERAMAALGARTAPLEQNVQRAAAEASDEASYELVSGIGAPVSKTDLGNQLRTRAEGLRKAYRAERDRLYGIVESDPRTQVKNISGDDLANEAKSLLGKQVTVETTRPSPIRGPTGKPVPITVTEVLEEFSEEGILPKIRALQRGLGQQFRLDELIKMRRSIDNDIAKGEAIPGVKNRELYKLRDSITNRIVTGLDAIDPALRQQWQDANDYVAREVGKFQRKGIAELFRDVEQGSYLGETALVDRVTGGGTGGGATNQDLYRAYRDFFGAKSPEMTGIQQSIRDETFGRDKIEGFIDAKGFINRITKLAKDAPDAFNDAFGANAARLRNSARALAVSEGATLPEKELITAVNSRNLSSESLRDLLSAQEVKDRAYRNELVKAVSEGNLKPDTIKPTEFVGRVVFKKDTQPRDMQALLGMLGDRPDILEDIRRLTFKKVLDDATIYSRSTGSKVYAAEDMERLLEDENMAKRLRTALGDSTFEDLKQLKDFLLPGQLVQQAAKSAGGMSAGSQIAGIWETGALKYADRAFRNFVVATMYTMRPVRKLLTNNLAGPEEQAAAVNLAIASTPFIEAMMEEFGPDVVKQGIQSMRGSIQRFASEQNQGQPAQSPQQSREEFMRSLGMNPATP